MTQAEVIARLLEISKQYGNLLNNKAKLTKDFKDQQLLIESKKAEKLSTRSSLTIKGKEAQAFNESIPEMIELTNLQKEIFTIDIDLDILNKEQAVLTTILPYLE